VPSQQSLFGVQQSLIASPPLIDIFEYMDTAAVASRFKALADPTRLEIVNRLACCDECCVCDLNASFDLAQPTISHHLKVLRDAGLVQVKRRGTWAYYRLDRDAVRELRQTLGR
jgi:ArsR family transcriptional regulator